MYGLYDLCVAWGIKTSLPNPIRYEDNGRVQNIVFLNDDYLLF
jgi:hypothetical protein